MLCLNLTSISYRFWNKGQKVLKVWKFDEEKGNKSKIGNQIYFKIAGKKKNWSKGRTARHIFEIQDEKY